jgi:hypothetical protein
MGLLTGMLAAFSVIGGLVTFEVSDETGNKRSLTCSIGNHGERTFDAYKDKNIEIAYEWGDADHAKLVRISLPTPKIDEPIRSLIHGEGRLGMAPSRTEMRPRVRRSTAPKHGSHTRRRSSQTRPSVGTIR